MDRQPNGFGLLSGFMCSSESPTLVGVVQYLGRLARDKICLSARHVKRHVGHPWNEGCDIIAKMCAEQKLWFSSVMHHVIPEGVNPTEFRQLAFFTEASSEVVNQFPEVGRDWGSLCSTFFGD